MIKTTSICLLVCLSFGYNLSHSDETISEESRLIKFLLERYRKHGKIARPRYNSSDQIAVQYGMRLIRMDLIEKEQLLKTSVWIRCRWVDEHLTWNASDFGGMKYVVLPSNTIWIPDIALVNTAETEVTERDADVMVGNNGATVWSPQRIFKSACLIDVTYFPYDKHTCDMWFQSMSRYTWQMDLFPYYHSPWDLKTYLSSFKVTQEWDILENTTQRYNSSKEAGVFLKYSKRVSLRFSLTLQRRIGYHGLLLMIPCVFLGSLTIVVFYLPPERPDRNTLATSLFSSFMVLTLILIEVVPPSAASIPKLGMYYAANMTLIMLSIFLSGFVINISRRHHQTIHPLLRMIVVKILSRIVFCHEHIKRTLDDDINKNHLKTLIKTNPFLNNHYSQNYHHQNDVDTQDTICVVNQRLENMETTVMKIKDVVCRNEKQREITLRIQWQSIAMVFDRLFVILYTIALIISFILFFPFPQNIFNS